MKIFRFTGRTRWARWAYRFFRNFLGALLLASVAHAQDASPYCTNYVVLPPKVLAAHVRATFTAEFSRPALLLTHSEVRAAVACAVRAAESQRDLAVETCAAGGFSASQAADFALRLGHLADLCIGLKDWTQ